MPVSLIGPKRRAFQTAVSLAVLLLPFVRVDGRSALRLDAPTRTLLCFGLQIRIEEFYLFLLAVLILTLGFLFITMVFGRVWCGWLCPQTTLADLAEWLDRLVARRVGSGLVVATVVRWLSSTFLAALVAANFVWYFIEPAQFFPRLLAGRLGPVAGITLVTVYLLVFLDLLLVRRHFCTSVCPYGRIQLMTMDRSTLTLEFDPARAAACIHCGSCERACPMGIDIKDGLQVECINCGRCLDACRQVMAARDGAGLIHYTFGSRQQGGGRPLNPKSLLLGGLLLVLTGTLQVATAQRREATIKVQRNAAATSRRLADGSRVNFYTAFLENRGSSPAPFGMMVADAGGRPVEVLGPVQAILLPANDNRRVDFSVRLPATAPAQRLTMILLREREVVGRAEIGFSLE